jgi:lipid-binding SYLF domain-containing protein
MKTICEIVAAVAVASSGTVYAQNLSDLSDRVANATQVVLEIMRRPDGGIPDSIVSKADCIAVIPSVKRARSSSVLLMGRGS